MYYYAQVDGEKRIRITDMAFGGDGIGRLSDGRVVFVPFTAPGDELSIVLTGEKKRFCRGKVLDIFHHSPVRVKPTCPHFGMCGGCRWQHITYEAQRAFKRNMLISELVKKVKDIDFESITGNLVPSNPFAYRTAARIQVKKGRTGFFREKSNILVPVVTCPVLSRRLQGMISGLGEVFASTKSTGFMEISEDVDHKTGVSLHLVSGFKHGLRDRIQTYADIVVIEGLDAANSKNFMNGGGFAYIPGQFVQKNNGINARLKQYVKDLVIRETGLRSFIELFAGSGNFTTMLAGLFERGIAAESAPLATRMLRYNLAVANTVVVRTNLYKKTGPLLAKTRDLLTSSAVVKGPDLLIADPPRAGLKDLFGFIEHVRPEHVVLISCYPPVFAHDVARLVRDGAYEIASIQPFDMFPQTAHFEVVGHFRRRK